MAYIAPSTRSAGALITAAIWNQDVVANPIALYAGAMSIASQAAFDDISASSATQLGRSDKRQLRETFRGLSCRTSPNADVAATTVVLLHADEIVCSNGVRRTPADNLSAVITTAGIGGLRASQAEAASTWYKIMYAYGASGEGLYLEQAKDFFLDEEQTTDNASNGLRFAGGSTNRGQTFDTDVTGPCPFVDVKLIKTASPTGRIWASIYATSAGAPTGAALKTSDKIDVSLVSTTAQIVRFIFRDPQTLTAATTYALVLEGDYTIDGANYISWRVNTAGGYAAGSAYYFNGATWTIDTGLDQWFKVYVTRNDNAVAPPSGYDSGYAQIGWVYNDSGSNFVQFAQLGRQWRRQNTNIVLNTTAVVPTLTDLSAVVPPIPVMAFHWELANSTAGSTMQGSSDLSSIYGGLFSFYWQEPVGGYYMDTSVFIPMSHQHMYFWVSANTGNVYFGGFEW